MLFSVLWGRGWSWDSRCYLQKHFPNILLFHVSGLIYACLLLINKLVKLIVKEFISMKNTTHVRIFKMHYNKNN